MLYAEAKLIMQRKRKTRGDRKKAIKQEMTKLRLPLYQRGQLFNVVVQCSTRLPQGLLLLTEHRSIGRRGIRFLGSQLFRCILRLQSNQDVPTKRGQDRLHDERANLLLPCHVVQPKKCRATYQ
ncbi:hypothetical protein CR513_17517, partial [Mucuna pruriens]